jgi:hypothetical protein
MSQDLIKISPEQFELQIYKISSRNLISLLRELIEYKWDYGKHFSQSEIEDIERKDSIIQKELMRRGLVTKENLDSFMQYMKLFNYKKRVF